MQFSLTSTMALAITMSSALSSATPIMRRQSNNTDRWPVKNFNTGCSPAACEYSFSVSRAAGPSNPGFNTTCSGNDSTDGWHVCSDSSISARILPQLDEWQVDVKQWYATDNEGGFSEVWANATVDLSATNFYVVIYKAEGAE